MLVAVLLVGAVGLLGFGNSLGSFVIQFQL